MEKYSINIASDFSDKPGGRWKSLGSNSGELFYETILLPKFEQAIACHELLYIYLDGVKSYPNSFLDQSFGELGRVKGAQVVCDKIIFKTQSFNWIVSYIKDEIWFKK
ncbi:DUF4325 domain-containing protein [uncultured Bacteroides sp.]|uniref:DUF4325 domain-containing protein n=1 Tax=uncultured Bacteroides sp. TaxID=162156 RepID=UPI002AAAB1E7|nr:DUF4325 domain-containing protein [uncultured Bacteroides sp.]